MGDIETVKVRNPNDPDGGHMVINRSDYREGEHELHEDHEGDVGSSETDAQRKVREEDEARRKHEANRGISGGTTRIASDRNPSGTFSEPTPTDIRYPNQNDTEFENNHGAFVNRSAADIRAEQGMEDKPGGLNPAVKEKVDEATAALAAVPGASDTKLPAAKAPTDTGASDREGDAFDDMTVPELKDYAETHDIDLGDATKKADIQQKLRDATKA